MTRDDAISRLRRQLPMLNGTGVTGMSVLGPFEGAGPDDADEIDVLLDIDIDAYPRFDLLTLSGIKADLEDELGMYVRVLIDRNLRHELREPFVRDGIRLNNDRNIRSASANYRVSRSDSYRPTRLRSGGV